MAGKFQRGSGCYECQSCGRKTRATGNNDNEHVRMCVQCYDIGEIENLIADGMYEDETELKELEQQIKDLEAEIVKKGGKIG